MNRPKITKKRVLVITVSFIVAGLLLVFFTAKKRTKPVIIQTSGLVEGIETNISSVVQGRVSKICCEEGDTGTEGDIIIELENDEVKALVDQALAGVEKAKAEVDVSESAIEGSKANLKSAEADIRNAEAGIG